MSSSSESESEFASDDESSVSTSSSPCFTLFPKLPTEIRLLIWRSAVPSPGINFFNVHSFPRDHAGANRSDSPCWLYLDLRRLDIADDDAAVARYDPSAWQARSALAQTCREAREAAAVPEARAAYVTLTRPKRGLYIRAGDGQLRRLTPPAPPSLRDGTSPRTGASAEVEPQVRRRVLVHVDDVLCLATENCSFNLPAEEFMDDPMAVVGWSFDPQLTPALPKNIPTARYCVETIRFNRSVWDTICEMLFREVPQERFHAYGAQLLLLFDACLPVDWGRKDTQALVDGVWRDRFGDIYFHPHCDMAAPVPGYQLCRVLPQKSNSRVRYMRSARLRSPKTLPRAAD
ncbi:hypothetical protein F4780DRAFT_782869 [Xylariomycetidae sp. FL0641]|nr:hypothetical protein F4780DRAFT_782869 [Xylariomycetidae sp. FL0641]